MASFKAKFPVLQELFAKNHRGGLCPPPQRGEHYHHHPHSITLELPNCRAETREEGAKTLNATIPISGYYFLSEVRLHHPITAAPPLDRPQVALVTPRVAQGCSLAAPAGKLLSAKPGGVVPVCGVTSRLVTRPQQGWNGSNSWHWTLLDFCLKQNLRRHLALVRSLTEHAMTWQHYTCF